MDIISCGKILMDITFIETILLTLFDIVGVIKPPAARN